ncbi:major facilitator superfamily domain-containing protein [Aspergillus ambiguus]|uniref:major facilitator superfamily domain-containing protein n=1 Tax=Aspergillus ambiguus TaxID=176160 RepID=UPI003CCD02F0
MAVSPGSQDHTQLADKPKHEDTAPRNGSVAEDGKQVVLVQFDDEFQDPCDWPSWRRWSITVITTLIFMLATLCATLVPPFIQVISDELGMDPKVEGPLTVSLYALAFALGPVMLAPVSEMFGRVPLALIGNTFYFVFNLACGFTRTKDQLIALRFLSGFGAGASPAISYAVVADCFRAEERGKALTVLNSAFIFANPVGAIVGGCTSQTVSWRFAFYSTSIVLGVLVLMQFFVQLESHKPLILERKKKQLSQARLTDVVYKVPDEDNGGGLIDLFYKRLFRPIHLLTTNPLVQVFSLHMAFAHGLTYLVMATFATMWEQHYHQTADIASLHYIAVGVGYFIGTLCLGFMDRIYCALKRRNSDVGRAEFCLPLMIIGAFAIPSSLFAYGWTAQYHVPWIALDIAMVPMTIGICVTYQCILAYLMEAFPDYAVSAAAAPWLPRGLFGFGFPLFAPTMYAELGYGWGNTLLGFLALVIGVLSPLFVWRYGERLRRRGSWLGHGH